MKRYTAAIWIAVALVMVFAAGTTAADVTGAVYKMNNQWLPAGWARAAVWVNFSLQLLAAIGLLCAVFIKHTRRWAWIPAGILLMAYTLYALIAYNGWAPRELCACISLIDGMSWGQTLTLNAILVALIGINGLIIRRERRRAMT